MDWQSAIYRKTSLEGVIRGLLCECWLAIVLLTDEKGNMLTRIPAEISVLISFLIVDLSVCSVISLIRRFQNKMHWFILLNGGSFFAAVFVLNRIFIYGRIASENVIEGVYFLKNFFYAGYVLLMINTMICCFLIKRGASFRWMHRTNANTNRKVHVDAMNRDILVRTAVYTAIYLLGILDHKEYDFVILIFYTMLSTGICVSTSSKFFEDEQGKRIRKEVINEVAFFLITTFVICCIRCFIAMRIEDFPGIFVIITMVTMLMLLHLIRIPMLICAAVECGEKVRHNL